MPAQFLYLKNGGSPTRWDGTRYFEYIAKVWADLPVGLQSLTEKARYDMPSNSPLSIWRSSVSHFEVAADRISIDATNDYGTRRFEFRYNGVRKFQTTSASLVYMPTIVVQELVKLRGGVLRHTIADMSGQLTTIHATSIAFREDVLQ